MVTRTVDESENWCHMGVKWLQPIGPNPSRVPLSVPFLQRTYSTFKPYVFPMHPDVSTPMHMDGPGD